MYYFYFNSGTTNSRGYLLKGRRIIDHEQTQVGSKDSALAQNPLILLDALYRIYQDVLKRNLVNDHEIADIYMSGMVTSPYGIKETEHLSTPINVRTLKKNIYLFDETHAFKRRLKLVPGLKTIPQGTRVSPQNAGQVNNMRGEEIEVLGILSACPGLKAGRHIVILPGSHTQIAFLEEGTITDISSNITGELFYALTQNTILGSSITGCTDEEIVPDMIRLGYDCAEKYGFNRALYITRSMDLFSDSTSGQRYSYLEGVINSGIITNLKNTAAACDSAVIVDGHDQFTVLCELINYQLPGLAVRSISDDPQMPFSVRGFLSLIE